MDMKDLDDFKKEIAKRCAGCDALERQGSAFLAQHKQLLDKIDENTKLTQKIFLCLNGDLASMGFITRVQKDMEDLARRVTAFESAGKEKRNSRRASVTWLLGVLSTIVSLLVVGLITNHLQFHIHP